MSRSSKSLPANPNNQQAFENNQQAFEKKH